MDTGLIDYALQASVNFLMHSYGLELPQCGVAKVWSEGTGIDIVHIFYNYFKLLYRQWKPYDS